MVTSSVLRCGSSPDVSTPALLLSILCTGTCEVQTSVVGLQQRWKYPMCTAFSRTLQSVDQPLLIMIVPTVFFPLTGGCSEGLDVFTFIYFFEDPDTKLL